MNPALKNIRRSPYQAIAAVLVLSLNLFVISLFTLVTLASQSILVYFETRPQIIAYLKDTAPESLVNETITNLNSTGLVKSIKYVSKNDALKIYKESVGNDPLLLGTVTQLGEVTADILPASLEVSVRSSSDFDHVAKVLEESDIVSLTPQGVKEIDFPKNIVSELAAWTKALRTAGVALAVVLSVTSINTIGTNVSLKIASRKTEIDTLKLIGAKNSFVLKPYLWETVIYSLIGGFFGWLFSFIVLLYSTPILVTRLEGIIPLPVPPLTVFFLLLFILSVSLLLGLFSGIFAVVRFLRR